MPGRVKKKKLSFINSSVIVIIGQIGILILGILTNSFISRSLGPDLVGNFELLRTTQLVLVAILSLGIGQAGIYFINSKNLDLGKVVSNSLILFIPLSFLYLISLILINVFFYDYFGSLTRIELFLFAVYGLVLLFNTFFKPIFIAKIEATNIVLTNAIPKGAMVVCFALLYVLGISKLSYAIFALLLSNILGALFIILKLYKFISFRNILDVSLIKEFIIYGSKLIAANTIFLLNNNVVIYLIRYYNPHSFDNLGYFTRAFILANLILVIPSSIAPLLFARWSGKDINSKIEESKIVLQISVVFSILLTGFLFLFAPIIIKILYGSDFMDAVIYLRVMAPVFVFTIVMYVLLNFFNSIGEPMKPLIITTISLVLNLIIGSILVSKYDALGGGYSFLISGILTTCVTLVVFTKSTKHTLIELFDFRELYRLINDNIRRK